MSLVSKLGQLVEVVEKADGNVTVDVDFANGSVTVNGITFNVAEQFQLMNEYSKDPNFTALIEAVNGSQAAKAVRSVVSFDGGTFAVDKEKANETLGTNFKVDDSKDVEIKRLRQQLAYAHARLDAYEGDVYDDSEELEYDGLVFPEDFTYAEIEDFVKDVSEEEIQEIITELEGIDVPEGQFILHRTKDVAVLKISDDEGISYLVAEGYYYANGKY